MMAIKVEHEIHQRRRSRNTGLGVTLAVFVALVFGLTVVKVTNIDFDEAEVRRESTTGPATGEVRP